MVAERVGRCRILNVGGNGKGRGIFRYRVISGGYRSKASRLAALDTDRAVVTGVARRNLGCAFIDVVVRVEEGDRTTFNGEGEKCIGVEAGGAAGKCLLNVERGGFAGVGKEQCHTARGGVSGVETIAGCDGEVRSAGLRHTVTCALRNAFKDRVLVVLEAELTVAVGRKRYVVGIQRIRLIALRIAAKHKCKGKGFAVTDAHDLLFHAQ